MSVLLVARRHGISRSQIFIWRRPIAQETLTATTLRSTSLPGDGL